MKRWVRNGLILMATLALLTQGHHKLFTPPVGRIPDGVISNRKATQDEKNHNKKLAKNYAEIADLSIKSCEVLNTLISDTKHLVKHTSSFSSTTITDE